MSSISARHDTAAVWVLWVCATAVASGRRFALTDGAETPDVVQVTYDYPGFVLSYEAMMLNAHGAGGRSPGRTYYGARVETDRPLGVA